MDKYETLYQNIESLINNNDSDLTTENANKDAKIVSTHRDLITGIVSKQYVMDKILPYHVINAHNSGYIHFHDADYAISPSLSNCCLVNYRDMLENGFKIGNAKIESPNSIGVATTVLTQIILAVSSSQYGGQTIAHIDSGLAPYVEKSWEKIVLKGMEYRLPQKYMWEQLEKEVYDAMQTFLYQTNSMTSCNGQTPFITISLGMGTSPFAKMITEAYLKVHKKGLGKDGVTPVFPKVLFFLQDGINMKEGDPNYKLKQLAIETCAERIYPDFISVPNNLEITGSTSEPVSSMGCRSYLSKYVDETGNEKYDGRFNLGVVSLNIPLIASESISERDFYQKLSDYMDVAFDAHMVRINRFKECTAKQNPIMFMEGVIARLNADDKLEKLVYNNYASASIGYIGMSETSMIIKNEINKNFILEVMEFMKSKCEDYKIKTNIGFSLYGTPSESLCYRFAKYVNEKYPNVLRGRDYITNSFHFPVWEEIELLDKFSYEIGFANVSNGGNISYVETPNLKDNLKALESIVNFGYEHMHYFGINQKIDVCYLCGYHGEFNADENGFSCPDCGNTDSDTISVIRRVSGYLGSPNSRPFNKGKQQEVIERKVHMK